jgi:hypothetical protein
MPLNDPVSGEYNLTPAPAPSAPTWQPYTPPAEVKPPPARPPSTPGLALLFIALAGGLVIGTILFQSRFTLAYCPNDGARWNTVYYLVVHHTYEYLPKHGAWWSTKPVIQPRDLPPFFTIDMVATKDANGGYHYFSSKPPLLPTCAAGVVIAIEKISALAEPAVHWLYRHVVARDLTLDGDGGRKLPTRASFRYTPHFIIPVTLILLQAVPFMIFLWIMARHMGESTDSPFARDFCIAAAALGTFLAPWSITFNNHVIAAFAALFAIHAAMRIWYDEHRGWRWFASAGFFAGLLCTLELPGLALTVAILAALAWKDWRRALTVGVIFAAIPIAAHFYTNYLQLGSFVPAYADLRTPGGLYDFPGSYWVPFPTEGLDGLTEPHRLYLMNILVGHHGIFLLTPIFLIALLGMGRHLRRPGLGIALLASTVLLGLGALVIADATQHGRIAEWLNQTLAPLTFGHNVQVPRGWTLLAPLGVLTLVNLGMYLPAPSKPQPMLALMIFAISSVLIGFYTMTTNNYGGTTQGPRWLIWLTPFWLLLLPAGVEWMAARRGRRVLACSLLFLSVMSAAAAFRQPWGESWAHTLFRHMGWIAY